MSDRNEQNETALRTEQAHGVTLYDSRVVCTCGDFDCASLNYMACAFALGRGLHCKGDVRFPSTHSTICPRYAEPPTLPDSPTPEEA